MNINDIEMKNKPKKEDSSTKNNDEKHVIEEVVVVETPKSQKTPARSVHDWMLILKLSLAIAACIGFILGSIVGFFIGKSIYYEMTPPSVNNTETGDTQDSIYSQYDYTKFVINADKNITIQSFYADDEERYFAMQMIGKTIPDLKYLGADSAEMSVKELGGDRYIIEMFQPDCTFCNKTIEIVDAYRADSPTIPVIGLSIKDGSLDAFNKNGVYSYRLVNKDTTTAQFVDMIVWVPTFIYVENDTIKLVTFGLMNSKDDIYTNIGIAFGDTTSEE